MLLHCGGRGKPESAAVDSHENAFHPLGATDHYVLRGFPEIFDLSQLFALKQPRPDCI